MPRVKSLKSPFLRGRDKFINLGEFCKRLYLYSISRTCDDLTLYNRVFDITLNTLFMSQWFDVRKIGVATVAGFDSAVIPGVYNCI